MHSWQKENNKVCYISKLMYRVYIYRSIGLQTPVIGSDVRVYSLYLIGEDRSVGLHAARATVVFQVG